MAVSDTYDVMEELGDALLMLDFGQLLASLANVICEMYTTVYIIGFD